jgi:hypothetical protein
MVDRLRALREAAKHVAANIDCLYFIISKCCTHKSPKKHAYFLSYLIIFSFSFCTLSNALGYSDTSLKSDLSNSSNCSG